MSAPQTVLITGASGLVGNELQRILREGGHTVRTLGRRPSDDPNHFVWSPARDELDPRALDGADVVLHLAGAPISQRWTDEAMRQIRDSRVAATALLVRTIAAVERPPSVLVSTSACGVYGDSGALPVREDTPTGRGFAADVCRAWEDAAMAATEHGLRVAISRTGLVLDPDGGLLGKLIPVFKLGGGGRIGSGRQYLPWVHNSDLCRAYWHAATTPSLTGPFNNCAPTPVTNRVFTSELASVLNRPALVPAPAFAIRLAFGQMGKELMLAGQNAQPAVLRDSGFAWEHPALAGALRDLLDR